MLLGIVSGSQILGCSMGLLKVSCDGCGKTAFGLTKVTDGRYLCDCCEAGLNGKSRYRCTGCGHETALPKQRGSLAVEIILWLFYLVPGLLYHYWRKGGTTCPACNKELLVDMTSGVHTTCPECNEVIMAGARKCKHCGSNIDPQRNRAAAT